VPRARTQQANLSAYPYTIHSMVNIKQRCCDYWLPTLQVLRSDSTRYSSPSPPTTRRTLQPLSHAPISCWL